MELKDKNCSPTKGPIPFLDDEKKIDLLNQLGAEWGMSALKDRIFKEYKFKNYKKALEFTNIIAEIAELEKHHPEIHLSWGKVEVIIWTHTNNNLHDNDFILAAKIENAFKHLSL